MTTVWLRDAGDEDDPCWVPCAKGDPGAVRFVQADTAYRELTPSELRKRDQWSRNLRGSTTNIPTGKQR